MAALRAMVEQRLFDATGDELTDRRATICAVIRDFCKLLDTGLEAEFDFDCDGCPCASAGPFTIFLQDGKMEVSGMPCPSGADHTCALWEMRSNGCDNCSDASTPR
eukprot:gene8108-1550_t